MEVEPRDEIVERVLDFASIGLAIHGLRTILNPDTFPIIDEAFHQRAIAEAEALGWFADGVLSAPPEVMSLVFKNNTPD